jgi:hypothetical protein
MILSKKVTLKLATVAALALAGPGLASAQEPPPAEMSPVPAAASKMRLGVDGNVNIPVGDLADGAGIGIGALLRFEYALQEQLSLTARAGYVYHFEKNSITFSQIPVMFGAKFLLTPEFFLTGEVGFVRAAASIDFQGQSVSADDTNLALGLGGGYQLNDQLSLRGGLNILDVGHAGESLVVFLGVGYDFWQQ